MGEIEALDLLRSARRIGFVFSGGSSRCTFQIGVLETLVALGVRTSLCVGVSAGVWNAAAMAAGTPHRLRHYWRAFVRMPPVDLGNLLREQEPAHEIPSPWRERTLVIRPRHRLPLAFTERRWSILSGIVEIGRLRAREVLLGESHEEITGVRGEIPLSGLLFARIARTRALLARVSKPGR